MLYVLDEDCEIFGAAVVLGLKWFGGGGEYFLSIGGGKVNDAHSGLSWR